MKKHLIVDAGAGAGDGSAFYLARGFKVVAIEADPALCTGMKKRFAEAVKKKNLTILNVGIGLKAGTFPFTVNEYYSVWSSFEPSLGKRTPPGVTEQKFRTVSVETVTLDTIIKKHGVPAYLKSTMEGSEEACLLGIEKLKEKPLLFSINGNVANFAQRMTRAGYSRFKLVSQTAAKSAAIGKTDKVVEEHYGEWLTAQDFDAELRRHLDGNYADSLHKKWGIPESDFSPKTTWFDFHAKR